MWCSGRAHEQEGGRNTYPPDDLCLVLFPQQLVGQQVLLPSHVLCIFITVGKERDLGSDRLRHLQRKNKAGDSPRSHNSQDEPPIPVEESVVRLEHAMHQGGAFDLGHCLAFAFPGAIPREGRGVRPGLSLRVV